MRYQVGRQGERFGVFDAGEVVCSPMGTPVVTAHRGLAEEMARDLTAWGDDPSRRTTSFALQAGYLDFGRRVPRAQLEVPILSLWPQDLFVRRPADPELAVPLLSLWGPEPFGRAEFARRVRALPLRKLMVLMQCGAQYQSAVLGLQLLETDRPAAGFAMGACARVWSCLNRDRTLGSGHLDFGAGSAGRHDPNDTDDDYCEETCCSGDGDVEAHPRRCPMTQVMDAMRRWAAHPEEPA